MQLITIKDYDVKRLFTHPCGVVAKSTIAIVRADAAANVEIWLQILRTATQTTRFTGGSLPLIMTAQPTPMSPSLPPQGPPAPSP